MAKYSYLELVQKVLNRIDDEPVNSIDETEEAQQVSFIVSDILNELVEEYPWPHMRIRTTLESPSANTMQLPTNVSNLLWVRYNDKDLTYESPFDFETRLGDRDTTLSNVDSNGAINDQDPTYWTSYDDETIHFDSYDGSLQIGLSVVQGVSTFSELSADNDVLGFPDKFHPVILHGCVAAAAASLKRDGNLISYHEIKFQQGVARLKRWAERINQGVSTHGVDASRKGVSRLISNRRLIEA